MSTIIKAADTLDRCAAVYERLAKLHQAEADKVTAHRTMMTGAAAAPVVEPMATLIAEATACRESAAELRRIA